jgi:hypothetical protein
LERRVRQRRGQAHFQRSDSGGRNEERGIEMRIQPAAIRMGLRKARRLQRRGITVAPAAQQRLIGGNSIKAEGER